jgi:hypothetical protein
MSISDWLGDKWHDLTTPSRWSSCPGVVYGIVKSSTDHLPIEGAEISIEEMKKDSLNELKRGGNMALTSKTPTVASNKEGEYVLPFYWADEVVVEDASHEMAKAHGFLRYSGAQHGGWQSASSKYKSGQVEVKPNWSKALNDVVNGVKPDVTSAGGAASKFLEFIEKSSPELKGATGMAGFASDAMNLTTSNQAIECRIDFEFETAPRVTAVGTQSGETEEK